MINSSWYEHPDYFNDGREEAVKEAMEDIREKIIFDFSQKFNGLPNDQIEAFIENTIEFAEDGDEIAEEILKFFAIDDMEIYAFKRDFLNFDKLFEFPEPDHED